MSAGIASLSNLRFSPRFVAGIGLIWIALTAAVAAQFAYNLQVPWSTALRMSAADWTPWLVLCLPVIWSARRFPLGHPYFVRHLCIHLAASFALGAIYNGLLKSSSKSSQMLPGAFQDSSAFNIEREASVFPPPAPPPFTLDAVPPPPLGAPPSPWHKLEFNILVYWTIIFSANGFQYYQRMLEQEQRANELGLNLTRAKLEALRLQLQPHFLFNTLNSVSALIHTHPQAADDMICSLGDLLRCSLSALDHEIPLFRELELLGHYTVIEKARLGERLAIDIRVDPAVHTAMVPTLILQPLVENSIRHGIEPRRATGRICITARRSGDLLRLSVMDDGVGIANTSRRAGIGLTNTKARIDELYGAKACISTRDADPSGTIVELQFPLRLSVTGTPLI